MWEETINTVFDCHMTIMTMCLIAVFIKSKFILAALSNTACRDMNALPHPTQVIVQNVSQMSCNMKLCEFLTLREEIIRKVLTDWFLEKLQHTKFPGTHSGFCFQHAITRDYDNL